MARDGRHGERIEELVLGEIPVRGPVFLVPNRLGPGDVATFERVLGAPLRLVRLAGMDLPADIRDEVEGKPLVTVLEQAADAAQQIGGSEDPALWLFLPPAVRSLPDLAVTAPTEILRGLLRAPCPVAPVCVETQPGRRVIAFGDRVDPDREPRMGAFRESALDAAEAAFGARPELQRHLGRAVLEGLKRGRARVIDGADHSELSAERLLAAAMVLARRIASKTQKPRAGILLPPGKGAFLANVAVVFAGKTPVNLNFTATKEAVESAIQQAGLDLFITAGAFMERLPRFSWPEDERLLLLDRVLPPLRLRILMQSWLNRLRSAEALAGSLGLPEKGGDREAVLLFTSGTSAEPKGVALSHANVLANVEQFGSRLNLTGDDGILGSLPVFHSFGSTVTLWFPLIAGHTTVTYPSPIEAATLAELIERYQLSLLLSTPTFLRGFLRKAKPEQLASLKLVVTGAEKLPAQLAQQFEEKFGIPVMEGYGLTETAPATNVNLPEPPDDGSGWPLVPSRRLGSVGLPLFGISARIRDPETDEPRSLLETGMLWFRGANVFRGYLNRPEGARPAVCDGWFRTGDLGRFDEDGFLYIEGRMSRFSKIGGEMVPHEAVEEAVEQALGLEGDHERRVVVVGRPDEHKGEALVLLAAFPGLDAGELRQALLRNGVPALWIPRQVVEVEEVPHLASGKLDLRACQEMASPG
ncbi:MAG TPA: AMP-binding protein [Verrucomicrobiales bacterium]|nr:AMP-binding protein [Verrucomicrobiales bacterium]